MMETIGHLVLDDGGIALPLGIHVREYLRELAEMDLWGNTEADVAATLIQHAVRQLIADGTLKLRRGGAGLLTGRRRDD